MKWLNWYVLLGLCVIESARFASNFCNARAQPAKSLLHLRTHQALRLTDDKPRLGLADTSFAEKCGGMRLVREECERNSSSVPSPC
ncbi:hypothetical protein EDB81DRAFT_797745 [Dactylonectria macrodidyma]|uniref:Secreted protein n=1 Tax=Dactylonectria macrodidyma TaxID=307937 RepID=A0A9P9EPR2_9HYPO|nr:hypothetical protein EDB81DRAFT_797745 [Dactylonectria macrodidyma]